MCDFVAEYVEIFGNSCLHFESLGANNFLLSLVRLSQYSLNFIAWFTHNHFVTHMSMISLIFDEPIFDYH